MDEDMYPVMDVAQGELDGKLLYQVNLSRKNFNYLLAGCPQGDCLIGLSPGGYHIRIYPSDSMPDAFRYADECWFASVGVPVDILPPHVSKQEFDRLAQKVEDDLEKAINSSNPVPIEDFGRTIGYVIMSIEK